ncbi:hypothetical protein PIB30_076961 [Stylosanthes scabra]|uniref:Uncharacterized protein n=1 Tax=Stylosanthes scabra TaxID=79078 RepID=A0ABU6ZP32_9FABA|nr:hypothetical protein [Stylosanthes scabra]
MMAGAEGEGSEIEGRSEGIEKDEGKGAMRIRLQQERWSDVLTIFALLHGAPSVFEESQARGKDGNGNQQKRHRSVRSCILSRALDNLG